MFSYGNPRRDWRVSTNSLSLIVCALLQTCQEQLRRGTYQKRARERERETQVSQWH